MTYVTRGGAADPVEIIGVADGVTIPVSPTAGIVQVQDSADNEVLGKTTDSAITTDTSGGMIGFLRGLVKWAYERMPTSLGQKTSANSFPVTLASDQAALSNYFVEVKRGNVSGVTAVEKFGANTAIPTTITPVTTSGTYQTPITAQTLEILSTAANDTAAGSGAQEVTIEGIVDGWGFGSTTVEMDGVTPVTVDTDFLRVFRMYVSRTGTYATATAASQEGTITLRGSGAGVTWGILELLAATFGAAQSQIAVYTVPINKTAVLMMKNITIETTKSVNVYLFTRDNANDITTPFTGVMKLKEFNIALVDTYNPSSIMPDLFITGPCDVGFMAKASANTAGVSVDFELLVYDD